MDPEQQGVCSQEEEQHRRAAQVEQQADQELLAQAAQCRADQQSDTANATSTPAATPATPAPAAPANATPANANMTGANGNPAVAPGTPAATPAGATATPANANKTGADGNPAVAPGTPAGTPAGPNATPANANMTGADGNPAVAPGTPVPTAPAVQAGAPAPANATPANANMTGPDGTPAVAPGTPAPTPAGTATADPGAANATPANANMTGPDGNPAVAPGTPTTAFDRLVCEDLMGSGQTTPHDTSVPQTEAVATPAATTGERQPEGFGSRALGAVRDAFIGPVTGQWWSKKAAEHSKIWGANSIYGTGPLATLQKSIASTRSVIDTVGSIASTVGLWSSILSLVGLIPGLQPIGAFLATVGEVCTIVGIACSAINILLSTANIAITIVRYAMEKLFGVKSGANFGAMLADDALNIFTSVVGIALSSAGGSLRGGIGEAGKAMGKGALAVGRSFFSGFGKQLGKTISRNLIRTGVPGASTIARGLVGKTLRNEGAALAGNMRLLNPTTWGGMWRELYREQATRWASMAVKRGLASEGGASGALSKAKPTDGNIDELINAWKAEQKQIRGIITAEYSPRPNAMPPGTPGPQTYTNVSPAGQTVDDAQAQLRNMVPGANPTAGQAGMPVGPADNLSSRINPGTGAASGSALTGGANPLSADRNDVVRNAYSRLYRSGTASPIIKKEAKNQVQGPPNGTVHRKAGGTADDTTSETEGAVAQSGLQGGGRSVPYAGEMSQAFGMDFSGVKAHTDPTAQQATRSLGAEAYTYGGQIAFGTESPNRATVAHELAHVVQDSSGLRRRTGGTEGHADEQAARAVEAVATSAPPVMPTALPAALAALVPTVGPDIASNIAARAQASSQRVAEGIFAPDTFKGPTQALPPEPGPVALEQIAQVSAQRDALIQMKASLAGRQSEAKTAIDESVETGANAQKWIGFSQEVQTGAVGMKQKYTQRGEELGSAAQKTQEGIGAAEGIQQKAHGVEGKAQGAQGRGGVQRASFPQNPSLWQRMKRFFLEGIVGRFNQALDRGKQMLVGFVTKSVMAALGMGDFKGQVVGAKGEALAGQKDMQGAGQKADVVQQKAQKGQQEGQQIKTEADARRGKAEALSGEIAGQSASVDAQIGALTAREAQLQGQVKQYQATVGPQVDATNAEITTANSGTGLEAHSTATVDPDIQAIGESAAEVQAASVAALAEVAARAQGVGAAAQADVLAVHHGGGAGGSAAAGIATSLILRHQAIESGRLARVQGAVSSAQGLAGQQPTPDNTRRLGDLHVLIEQEARGIEATKQSILQALHAEFSSLYDELVAQAQQAQVQALL